MNVNGPHDAVEVLFGDGLSHQAIANRTGLPLAAVERILRPDELAEYRSRTSGPITIEHGFTYPDGRPFVADGSALDWARASQIGINAERRAGRYPSTHPEFGRPPTDTNEDEE